MNLYIKHTFSNYPNGGDVKILEKKEIKKSEFPNCNSSGFWGI